MFPALYCRFPLFILYVVSIVYIWDRLVLFCCSVVSDSFSTPWAIAPQAPLSMGSSRQEHWSGLPFPPPGNPPDPGVTPESPALASGFFITEPPGKSIKTGEIFKCYYKYTRHRCHLANSSQQLLRNPKPTLCMQSWGSLPSTLDFTTDGRKLTAQQSPGPAVWPCVQHSACRPQNQPGAIFMPARYMYTPEASMVTCRKAHLIPSGQSPKRHNLIPACSPAGHIAACV